MTPTRILLAVFKRTGSTYPTKSYLTHHLHGMRTQSISKNVSGVRAEDYGSLFGALCKTRSHRPIISGRWKADQACRYCLSVGTRDVIKIPRQGGYHLFRGIGDRSRQIWITKFIYVVMSGASTLVVAQFLANQRDNLGVKCIYLMRARVITFTIIVVVASFLIATPTPTNSYGSI